MSEKADKELAVRLAYQDLLMREPASQALNDWVNSPFSIEIIRQKIQESDEYGNIRASLKVSSTPCEKKVLLFGAYGNGNLGDMIQANSLRQTIQRLFPMVGVWATSAMARHYPFEEEFKLPKSFIRYADGVRQFDALLIGGGGLLAHPHDPLADRKWVQSLSIPVLLYGVGSSNFFAPQAEALIQKAAHVSGRDFESLNSLLSFRSDAKFVIDPVLGDAHVNTSPETAQHRICWVLKAPINEIHLQVKNQLSPEDVIVAFEPEVDKPLREHFPDVKYVSTAEEFFSIARKSQRIVSMRYHGVILGLKASVPSFALDVPKAAALLDMLGMPECASQYPQKIVDQPAADTTRTTLIVRWFERYYDMEMKNALSTAFISKSV